MSDHTEDVGCRHAERLLEKANVVGVAGGDDRVLVFVTEKQPLTVLAADDVVDREVDGVRTDVIEVGVLEPMLDAGASIGITGRGTGTAGGVVADEFGDLYALTNNHVAADSNRARGGTEIVAPGPADGNGRRVGSLARFEPLTFDRANRVDAALVRLDQDAQPTHPPRTATARTGWAVSKTGRTTGYTEGEVTGRAATVDVNFGTLGVVRFVGQLVTTKMLEPGDSGSVLTSRGGYPVGLAFAGSARASIHTPINLVLRTLAVRFPEATT